jgi:hypothetical protein
VKGAAKKRDKPSETGAAPPAERSIYNSRLYCRVAARLDTYRPSSGVEIVLHQHDLRGVVPVRDAQRQTGAIFQSPAVRKARGRRDVRG